MTPDGVDPAPDRRLEPDPWTSALERETEQARTIGSAVVAVDGVAALSPADGSTVAPPHGVHGVRLGDDQVDVHVVADFGTPLTTTAENIGRAVAPMLGGRALQVSIEDILLPGESLTPPTDSTVPDG